MQEEKNQSQKNIQDLYKDVKEHVDTRLEYVKLTAIEKFSVFTANLITDAAVVVCFILAFLFGTFTLALYLSTLLGSFVKGFGVMSLIYILIAWVIYIIKDRYLEKRLTNVLVSRFFNKIADEEVEVEDEEV